jgi:tRNA(fMet)-specific endonuclease VapC
MTTRYLLDTDWIIQYFHGHPEVIRRVDELRGEGVGLAVVSLAEVYEGVYYSRYPQETERQLIEFLRGFPVLNIDLETCKLFGRERGRLRAARQMIGDFDLLIGAIALQHQMTLLSNNRRHFETIEGLQLESV